MKKRTSSVAGADGGTAGQNAAVWRPSLRAAAATRSPRRRTLTCRGRLSRFPMGGRDGRSPFFQHLGFLLTVFCSAIPQWPHRTAPNSFRSQQSPLPAVSAPSCFRSQQFPLPAFSAPRSFHSQQFPLPAVSDPSSSSSQQFQFPVVLTPSSFHFQQFPLSEVSLPVVSAPICLAPSSFHSQQLLMGQLLSKTPMVDPVACAHGPIAKQNTVGRNPGC